MNAELVNRFLRFACWDHTIRGRDMHRMHDSAAQRLLTQHPDIARANLCAAVVCGDIDEVRQQLAANPNLATVACGDRDWTPLLHICFARFSNAATHEHAAAIATLLLEHGANPNDSFNAGDASYTALTGIAADGDERAPRQPQAASIFAILLTAGAAPFDRQVLRNTSVSGDMRWWLDLVYEHTAARSMKVQWQERDWWMFDLGARGSGARVVLNTAIENGDRDLVRWALDHHANPNAVQPPRKKGANAPHSLYQLALMRGQLDIAEMLLKHGARPGGAVLTDDEAFAAAAFRLDRAEVLERSERDPDLLLSPRALFNAAKRDRADVAALLLDVGVPINMATKKNVRALHHAAEHDARGVAQLLLDRGADVDPLDATWQRAPIGWAADAGKSAMVDLLSAHSRDLATLAYHGYVDRIRQLLQVGGSHVRGGDSNRQTALWSLPEDEAIAIGIAELLVEHGADPMGVDATGTSAAQWSENRGQLLLAGRLNELSESSMKRGKSR